MMRDDREVSEQKRYAISDVSISTTIMNRLWLLKQALPTWTKFPFKMIYILNWNSDDTEELHEYVKSFNDSRIVVEDVTGKRTSYFRASISRNMAADRCLELSKPEFLLMIDADVKLNESFGQLELYKDIMYFSKWSKYLIHPEWEDNDSTFAKVSLNMEVVEKNRMKYGEFGTALFPVEKLWKYGHFDENLIENNLFDTLFLSAFFSPDDFENIWFFRKEIEHIDHSNDTRCSNQSEDNFKRAIRINQALRVLRGEYGDFRYPFTVVESADGKGKFGKIIID